LGIIAMLAAAMLAALPTGAGAASYRERHAELERLIRDKRAAIADASAREHNILVRLQESDLRLASLQRALDFVESRLSTARDNLSAQQQILDARVSQIYMDSPSSFSKAYALAQSFSDVVAASQYAVSVIRSDQEVVAKIEASKAALETQRVDIAAKQQDLATKRAAAAQVTQQVAAIVAERAAARHAVVVEIGNRRQLLKQVRSQKSSYKRALDSLLSESRSIEALLRGAQRGQRVLQGYGGYLKWPVSGQITSPFGWRIHPIYHYRSFHTGIDIGAPAGRTVKAARYGNVIYTGYKGAYGLIVIIDHGNSLATIYAHLSRVYVRAGEHVSRLESIAAVGSTGWSTGPHLHFEVRVNGTPVNPVRWL